MRFLKLCVCLFTALLVLGQVVQAQTSVNVQPNEAPRTLAEYRKDFKTGYTLSVGLTEIFGQVFRPVPGNVELYAGYPGVELTLDAGADFSQQVVTDVNGYFSFEDVPVGAFTVYAQNPETNAFGSVSVLLSRDISNVSTMSGLATSFDPADLMLLFTDKDLFILGRTRDEKAHAKPVEGAEAASHMATVGSGAGFGGGMGMFGAALGAAGLATGIAALATNKESQPVTVGAPSSR